MKLGFVGLGAMGLPMTRNLVAAGHQVTVTSRSEATHRRGDRVRCHRRRHARRCGDIQRGPHPLRSQFPRGGAGTRCHRPVPRTGHDRRGLLHHRPRRRAGPARAGARHGRPLSRRPVSGGTVGAKKGTLTLMVGGDEATLEDARPALDPMAGLIVHVGGPGDGPGREALQQPHLRRADGGHGGSHRPGDALGSRHGQTARGARALDR